ncbi:LacI family DNA-binding transcriptional regulator [Dongia sedimenti]|uniref:LacI family DNA-binding transcriptional regulator n=1 Tax=Dongia sedimenti TaxID=3064282 RepID=A0ABU0YNW7_9PROT|nr:LacI family DNA-binding transcriptional regulator [Rhodospirillaceae bacterium R-7]
MAFSPDRQPALLRRSESQRQMAKPPTIHAVAARAGVSTATVSKVVNRINVGMSETTRQRVEEAIRDLGYRPSRVGRSLRTLRRSTIGMAIVDASPSFLADPFTTNLVAGLTNHLSARGFGLLLHGIKPHELRDSVLVRESEVDALCVTLSGSRRDRLSYIKLLTELGQPFVTFQDQPVASAKDACFVRQDDRAGAVGLARYILEKRRAKRAVMFISELSWPAIEQRVSGFRDVFDDKRVSLDLVRCDETSSASIVAAAEAYLARTAPPDVFIGQNDQVALTVMQVLKRHNIRVPGDVGVCGFNAFPFSGFADPPLTTARSPAYELGQLGAAVILDRLEAGHFRKREHVLAVDLVAGASV